MVNYIRNINDALLGIPEKFRLEKLTIKSNLNALIEELKKEQNEDREEQDDK